jgi:hypothetical protein
MIKAPTPYLNETLPDSTRRDALRKNVNRVYLDSWYKQQFVFSSVENDSLNAYAYGNPYALGDGVLSARVLLGLDPDKVPLTQSAEANQNQETKTTIKFYPNPGREKICFEWGSEDTESQLDFFLYDSYGKHILSKGIPAQPGEICVPLPSHLSPGLYVVKLNDQSGNQLSGKIIIR